MSRRDIFVFLIVAIIIDNPSQGVSVSLQNVVVPTFIEKDGFPIATRKINETAAAAVQMKCIVKKGEEEADVSDATKISWKYNGKALPKLGFESKAPVCNSTKRVCTYVLELKNVADKLSDRIGNYTCKYGSQQDEGLLLIAPIIGFGEKQSRSGMEGDTFSQACQVVAYPEVKNITWSKQNDSLVFGDEIKQEKFSLKFSNLKKTDKGVFICSAENVHGKTEAGIDLRVKDKFAALWPFIGIVIEVIVLVTIILLYEKKRASKKVPVAEEEDGANPKEHLTPATENTDVRQRPVKA